MNSKIWITNFILVLVLFFLGVEVFSLWAETTVKVSADRSQENKKYTKGLSEKVLNSNGMRTLDKEKYEMVATESLFSSTRKEFVSVEEPQIIPEKTITQIPLSPPDIKFFVYGIVIMEGYKSALISNPRSGKGAPKNLNVKEGDWVDTFQVTAIFQDKVQIKMEDTVFEYYLFDNKKPARPQMKKNEQNETRLISVDSGNNGDAVGSEKKTEADVKLIKLDEQKEKIAEKSAPQSTESIINTPFGKIKLKK